MVVAVVVMVITAAQAVVVGVCGIAGWNFSVKGGGL